MLRDIITEMSSLELSPQQLNQPISLTKDGEVITVRDWIVCKAPKAALTDLRLNKTNCTAKKKAQLRSVSELDGNDAKDLAIKIVENSDPNLMLSFAGRGTYDKSMLLDEMKQGTDVGRRLIKALKRQSIFMEKAIAEGKVKLTNRAEDIEFPEFDFGQKSDSNRKL